MAEDCTHAVVLFYWPHEGWKACLGTEHRNNRECRSLKNLMHTHQRKVLAYAVGVERNQWRCIYG
jgi:hypothetical protein